MTIEKIDKTLESKTEKLNSKSVSKSSLQQPKKNGGARPGAGRPKGKKSPKTLEREEALKQFRERVSKNTDKLFNAQLNKALGHTMLFVKVRTKGSKGKPGRTYFERVEDEATIKQFLDDPDSMNDDEHYYFITTKPADNKAIDSMLDRTYGKAQQNIDLTSGGGKIEPVTVRIINEPPKTRNRNTK